MLLEAFIALSTYPIMTASSLPSPKPEPKDAASSTIWSFLGAPIAGNASFIGGFLYWLAIALRWFLRLLLLLLVAGIILGLGALIYGSLPLRNNRRGCKSKPPGNDSAVLDANVVELEFMAADFDREDGCISDSDDGR